MNSLPEWLAYIERLHPKKWDLGLDRVKGVAETLGLTEHRGIVFLVAGTNGKGSTCEFIDGLCRAKGLTVGKSTSPHLLAFNERIQVNGEPASNAEIVDAFAAIESARDEISLSYFEFAVLASLIVFKRRDVDVLVLEIGLGGRLDAMNIVDRDVTVITQIALDHQAWLGDTRDEIAAEKAAIMRTGKPCVIADRDPPLSLVQYAETLDVEAHYIGKDFDFVDGAVRIADQQFSGITSSYLPKDSAAAAVQALISAGISLEAAEVREVLGNTFMPGRLQWIKGEPALLLDVAHNPAAAEYLRDYVSEHLKSRGSMKPAVHAVVGMYEDKDCPEVLRLLSDVVDHWHFTDLQEERAASSGQLAENLKSTQNHRCQVVTYDKIQDAFNNAVRHCAIEDLIVVFGSFPVVAGVLQSASSHVSKERS
ncbi:MAG TPA: bifunctional tetrahydrofolate synthase/dihydrofolate synthase [Gammaproteobacteria bacterium]|nr:bifunctional tetrahydrofolate synthase/dihydrofolate synthase [Gammaproteobacteria bacterium]